MELTHEQRNAIFTIMGIALGFMMSAIVMEDICMTLGLIGAGVLTLFLGLVLMSTTEED